MSQLERRSERFGDWVLFGPKANVIVEGTLDLVLPLSRRTVEVKRRLLGFEEWTRRKPKLPRIWSSKGYLKYDRKPKFAELVILRMLQKEGWEGVWVNNFAGQFPNGLPKTAALRALAPHAQRVFDQIVQRNGGCRGCWDVLAWRKRRVVFAEAKRMKKDHIRGSQRAWLEAALEVGVPLTAFLIVEWRLV